MWRNLEAPLQEAHLLLTRTTKANPELLQWRTVVGNEENVGVVSLAPLRQGNCLALCLCQCHHDPGSIGILGHSFGTLSALRHQETKTSWLKPFLNDNQWDALRFLEKKADGLNLGIKRMTNVFAPGMEAMFFAPLQKNVQKMYQKTYYFAGAKWLVQLEATVN